MLLVPNDFHSPDNLCFRTWNEKTKNSDKKFEKDSKLQNNKSNPKSFEKDIFRLVIYKIRVLGVSHRWVESVDMIY